MIIRARTEKELVMGSEIEVMTVTVIEGNHEASWKEDMEVIRQRFDCDEDVVCSAFRICYLNAKALIDMEKERTGNGITQ